MVATAQKWSFVCSRHAQVGLKFISMQLRDVSNPSWLFASFKLKTCYLKWTLKQTIQCLESPWWPQQCFPAPCIVHVVSSWNYATLACWQSKTLGICLVLSFKPCNYAGNFCVYFKPSSIVDNEGLDFRSCCFKQAARIFDKWALLHDVENCIVFRHDHA